MSRSLRGTIFVVVLALFLAGCAPQTSETVWTAESTPLIERDVLFGNPEKAGVQISPDGSKISFLAPVEGVLNVWIAPIDAPDAATPVTDDTGRGIRTYFWAYTNDHVLYLQDKGGDENWRVYATDVSTKETRDLTPMENVQARILGVHHDFPDDILIGLNDRNPQVHDVYRLNIGSGDLEITNRHDRRRLSLAAQQHDEQQSKTNGQLAYHFIPRVFAIPLAGAGASSESLKKAISESLRCAGLSRIMM